MTVTNIFIGRLSFSPRRLQLRDRRVHDRYCDYTFGYFICLYGWNNLGYSCQLLCGAARHVDLFCRKFDFGVSSYIVVLSLGHSEIRLTGLPQYMAIVLFVFPLIFYSVLIYSRYHAVPAKRNGLLGVGLTILGLLYVSLINETDSKIELFTAIDLFDVDAGLLAVFVSVVFVNSPTIFRIIRGLTMDIKTRDYVVAAQTRGEGALCIMLWEILPSARGPLILDFCLRIGYITILLGKLSFFGLGLSPEDPNWGAAINDGRELPIYPHAALVPSFALLNLVLGLNLLVDGLREESLKD